MSNGDYLHSDLSELRTALREELKTKADKEDIVRIEIQLAEYIRKATEKLDQTDTRSIRNSAIIKTMLWGFPLICSVIGILVAYFT